MQPVARRAFLRILGSAAVTASFARSIEKAVATPASYRTGTIVRGRRYFFQRRQ